MPKRQGTEGITVQDCIDYQLAVESMYGLHITVTLNVGASHVLGNWAVEAVAWEKNVDGVLRSTSKRMVTYPSVHYKNFPGAIMGALMALEDTIAAQYWLKHMTPRPKR